MSKKFVTALATAAVAASIVATGAAPAQAATARNGVCETGEVCFYYNSGYAGSMSDFSASVANYGTDPATCYVFKSAGAGQGLCIKNNVASVRNKSSQPVKVFYNSSYGGTYQTIGANSAANLNTTMKNNNASHQFVSPGPESTNMSYALYKASGGSLTCGFDGYVNTPGRHEGIDFARGRGSAIYSLTSGTVTRVVYGSDSADTLSLIAIYNASTDRTVLYLHTAPVSLTVGQSIAKGQKIATEAARGNGGVHTHVEMRAGRQTSAAYSVNDWNLDNPNPTTFWVSQGYAVR